MQQVSGRILVLGHGECGKDTACYILSKLTRLSVAPSTSEVIISITSAVVQGSSLNTDRLSVQELAEGLREERRAYRQKLKQIGSNLCHMFSPEFLLQTALLYGDIANGVRRKEELEAAKELGVTQVWWIDADVPEDGTMEITSEDASNFADACGAYYFYVFNPKNSLEELEKDIQESLGTVYQ